MGTLVFVIWITGVAVAWLQLSVWSKGLGMGRMHYVLLAALSLFSWMIYPIYYINRMFNELND